MIHSTKMAMELHSKLPAKEAPEHTEGYEGFFHLTSMSGNVEETKLQYIIRDFKRDQFEARKEKLSSIVKELQTVYGEDRITLELKDQYYNMRDKIEPVKEIVNTAHEVMVGLGIQPIVKPIRGGTDGSQLSYMGLPTPNIFTGGENYHGKYEFVSVDNMVKASTVIVGISKRFAEIHAR